MKHQVTITYTEGEEKLAVKSIWCPYKIPVRAIKDLIKQWRTEEISDTLILVRIEKILQELEDSA